MHVFFNMYPAVHVEPLSVKRLNFSVLHKRLIGKKYYVSYQIYRIVVPVMLPFLVLISILTYPLQLSTTLILYTLNFTG
jgi:hypothetical protein